MERIINERESRIDIRELVNKVGKVSHCILRWSITKKGNIVPKNFIVLGGTILTKGIIRRMYTIFPELNSLSSIKLLLLVKAYHEKIKTPTKLPILKEFMSGYIYPELVSAYSKFNKYKEICEYLSDKDKIRGDNIEYLSLRFGKEIAQKKLEIKSARVKGDKNPAYQHGGRLSPYSDKFFKYQDGTADYTKEDVINNQKRTIKEHPENRTTNIEYYLTQGMPEEEAKDALRERQVTNGTLWHIERYGEEEGLKKQAQRNEQWLNTLGDFTDEEKERINRSKSTKVNYKTLWGKELDIPGTFYILNIGDGLIKYGITSRSVAERYKIGTKYTILYQITDTINVCFSLEQIIKKELEKYKISRTDAIEPFGWTETLRVDEDVIIDYAKNEYRSICA